MSHEAHTLKQLPVRALPQALVAERVKSRSRLQTQEGASMTSPNPRPDIYDPKTLAVMDQAFAAIWTVLRTDDPFRDYAQDSELRLAIGHKLMDLVADGVTDPFRLQKLTVEGLLFPHH
jgi:hypothetical protein